MVTQKSTNSPHVIFSLLMLHYANAASQSTIVHATAQSPLIALGIIHLDRLQIGSPVKAADRIELTIHNR